MHRRPTQFPYKNEGRPGSLSNKYSKFRIQTRFPDMTQEQKQKIYETFMNKTSKKRRLNEDFLDNVSTDDIKRQDDSLENPDYIMQDGRPVSELLSDYMCCVHTCINFDFMIRIKALCTRLRQLTERLPFNLDVSPVIISYGLTED